MRGRAEGIPASQRSWAPVCPSPELQFLDPALAFPIEHLHLPMQALGNKGEDLYFPSRFFLRLWAIPFEGLWKSSQLSKWKWRQSVSRNLRSHFWGMESNLPNVIPWADNRARTKSCVSYLLVHSTFHVPWRAFGILNTGLPLSFL